MGLENPFNYSTFYWYSVDLSADGACGGFYAKHLQRVN